MKGYQSLVFNFFFLKLSAENESTPIQQLLEHFLHQLQRKDPHGFFAFPVTDAIAPGYSMIIKHPMDFGTMKDKIVANEYKSVTEFKADFKLMCDNAMTYNRPDTVYYKLAKKILHAGFKMMSKERLLALKRSMSFMQDMDFSQQAALLGNEDTAVEEPVPEVVPVQVETAKKSKKPSREVISCMFEPEGNACSLTDSTAEEHVLALVEHAADEARDRINRFLPGGKVVCSVATERGCHVAPDSLCASPSGLVLCDLAQPLGSRGQRGALTGGPDQTHIRLVSSVGVQVPLAGLPLVFHASWRPRGH
nr:bromodomain-containing protein 9-like isoform X2 [Gorilla gorilla gorilla]XP_055210155.1 bromodomain-containing protein 9-like isoform X2 [Gorilla gorilla gorilla]